MTIEPQLSCAMARDLDETLYGTAKTARIYFLLEYNPAWEFDAVEASTIPQAVKDRLRGVDGAELLLIRQPGRAAETDGKVQFFAATAADRQPALYRMDLDSYEAILSLDLDALLSGDLVAAQTDPLYAVCTNGRRDQCCSIHGIPLYNALSGIAGDATWQISHIGGHRLAATMFCFPHAICYGFVGTDDAASIDSSYRQDTLLLDKFRGRATMEKPAQAAEYFLRQHLKHDAIADVHLLDMDSGDDRWTVRFDVAGTIYAVSIKAAEPLTVLTTTGVDEYKPIPKFALDSIEKTL